MTTKTKPLSTWQDLLAIDATLRDIDRQLAFWRDRITSRNQWQVYERMKAQVSRRVGFDARHAPEELQTTTAYEIAIGHICDELGI